MTTPEISSDQTWHVGLTEASQRDTVVQLGPVFVNTVCSEIGTMSTLVKFSRLHRFGEFPSKHRNFVVIPWEEERSVFRDSGRIDDQLRS